MTSGTQKRTSTQWIVVCSSGLFAFRSFFFSCWEISQIFSFTQYNSMSCMMMMAQEEKEVEEEPQSVFLRTLESQRVSENHRPTGTIAGHTGSRLLENQGYGWDYRASAPGMQDPLTPAYAESLVETSEEEMGKNSLPVP
jgi:hypothetical protein